MPAGRTWLRMAVASSSAAQASSRARRISRCGGGSIVNFGSVTWMIGDGDCPAYVTAKAAVNGVTRALARELGTENIRVNCVVLGWVMTRRQLDLWVTPEGEALIEARTSTTRRSTAGPSTRCFRTTPCFR